MFTDVLPVDATEAVLSEEGRRWVRALMAATGLDATNLARRAGISQSTLSRFLRAETDTLTPRVLAQLNALGVVPLPQTLRGSANRFAATDPAQAPAPKPETIPLWGVHPLANGFFRLNPVPLQTFPRPPRIAGSSRLAAFYAHDDSMQPRWRMGELMLVDLSRPPGEGGVALVTALGSAAGPGDAGHREAGRHEPGQRDEVQIVRQYLGRSAGHVRLRAFSSGDTVEDLSIERVLQLRHILDWRDLIG